MDNSILHKGIMMMKTGYAFNRILLDDNGYPCDFEILDVNPSFENCTGLIRNDIIGKKATEVMPGIKRAEFDWIKTYGAAALRGCDFEFERYSDLFDKWFRIHVFSPEKYYFITEMTDITKERADRFNTEYTEQKWKGYADSVPYCILIADKNGAILESNLESCRIFGYTKAELRALTIQTIWKSDHQEEWLSILEEAASKGVAAREIQHETAERGKRWLAAGARTLPDESTIVFCHDITYRKKLEEDLIKGEQLYRTFIDASDDIITLKDDELRYVIVNKALTQSQYFNKSKSEILGKTDAELLIEEEVRLYGESDRQVLMTKTVNNSEAWLDDWVFAAKKFPVPLGDGRIGVGAYIRDVTNEKRQEAQLKRTMERHKILAETLMMTFHSKQEHIEYALQNALSITGSQYGYIYLYDESTEELTFNSWTQGVMETCGIPQNQMKYQLETAGLWGEVIRQRKPIIFNDLDEPHPKKKGYPDGHVPLRNFMSIPVIFSERIVAAVGLGNKNINYDDNDVYELSMLMNGIFQAAEKREALSRVEELLAHRQAMFNEHDAVMLLVDPHTGAIVDANPAASAFYGYSKNELLALSIREIDMQSAEEVNKRLARLLSGKQKNFSVPHRMRNGEQKIVDVYACPISYGDKSLLFAIIFDVTEKEIAFEEITYLSYHDHLTGIYNRRYFDLMLNDLNTADNLPITIVMADVNGLKMVNDAFGHAEGDSLLIKAAEIIKESCRKDDIVARIGGDEFAIILPKTDENEAIAIMDRIKRRQSTVIIKQIAISLSFGYTVKYEVGSDMGLVLSKAEDMMYRNKMYESTSIRNKTISIIMNTLFEKSRRELEHSNRVSAIAAAIAKAMNLDTEQVNRIEVAGLLHDIGKIGIDEKILNKPGTLDSVERYEIMKHPESGWRILSNSDEFSDLADFILNHHEHYDGNGYPRRIKGDSIPIPSRIIAIADAYDAMTMDRPYRKAMSPEIALAEIRRHTGTQFDPNITEVFIAHVQKNDDYFSSASENSLYKRIFKEKVSLD